MIVVLGRPSLDERGAVAGTAGRVAIAAAAAGADVELVGSVGDDETGDLAVTALGTAGVGHAALLRMPGGRSCDRSTRADIELGLRYVADCRVLVIAEPLGGEALRAAVDGAAYHGAQLIVVREPGADAPEGVPDSATVLEQPDEDAGAFTGLVGRYAARLDRGASHLDAWRDALSDTGWEQAPA